MSGSLGYNLQVARKRLDYTQLDVANAIGVSRPTYAQIESNEKDITIRQLNVLAAMLDLNITDLFDLSSVANQANKSPESSPVATSKYKQIILNALQFGADTRDGKITKTKLAKLVYLADFTWYYNHLEPMSGMAYRKLPRGPVADIYFRAIDELIEDGVITMQESGRAFMISMTEAGRAPSDLISAKQRTFIKELGRAWKDKQTTEIVNFTHSQIPWRISKDGETIPYSLIIQEETKNVYGPAKLADM